MKRRRPEYYTLFIARSGKQPTILSIRATTFLLAPAILLVLVASAFKVWHIWEVKQQNLRQEAQEVLERVEQLESQVERLKRRSGLRDFDSFSPSGGKRLPLNATEVLDLAKHRTTELSVELERRVEPAIERQLAIRAELPRGFPLADNQRITSEFGKRQNPFGRGYELHDGIDFAGNYGTPVYATAAGTVLKTGWLGGYGKRVLVEHPHGYRTLYGHLSEIAVDANTPIERGQLLGYVGSTGRSTGPHLHYSIYLDETAIDPKDYLDETPTTLPKNLGLKPRLSRTALGYTILRQVIPRQ